MQEKRDCWSDGMNDWSDDAVVAALRGCWMLPFPVDQLGMHLPEILETSLLQALGVYKAYLLHSEHVLIPHWNQCSSSTNTHTTSKCRWKGAEQLERHLDFWMKPESERNPAFVEMTFEQKGVWFFFSYFYFFQYCKHAAKPQMHMELQKRVLSCKPEPAHPRNTLCSWRWGLRGFSLPLHHV